ncbi:hypothetical protein BDZ91DRAFT_736545 [Kalaharituber pfeilii]|nr:hypothetical protein BDZ91DRAFT_736545 [Kalaharituber pfeilii]
MPRRRNKKRSEAGQTAGGSTAIASTARTASTNNAPSIGLGRGGSAEHATRVTVQPQAPNRNSALVSVSNASTNHRVLHAPGGNGEPDTVVASEVDVDEGWQQVVSRSHLRRADRSMSWDQSHGPWDELEFEDTWHSLLEARLRCQFPAIQSDAMWERVLGRPPVHTTASAMALASNNFMSAFSDISANDDLESIFSSSAGGFEFEVPVSPLRRPIPPLDAEEEWPSLPPPGGSTSQVPARRQSAPAENRRFSSAVPIATQSSVPTQPTSRPSRPIPPPETRLPPPSVLAPTVGPSSTASSDNHASALSHLRDLAEEASVLLEIYSQTTPGEAEGTNLETVKAAFEAVSKIWDEYKPKQNIRPARVPELLREKGKEKEDGNMDTSMMIYSACIVCYNSVADTVFMPCHHLVLCSGCCDVMGIKEKGTAWVTEGVPCPLCRTLVTSRIKIYRG